MMKVTLWHRWVRVDFSINRTQLMGEKNLILTPPSHHTQNSFPNVLQSTCETQNKVLETNTGNLSA